MSDHRIHLDQVFEGPMDLLLHLVREQEVEIHEVEILRIIDGFLAYIEELSVVDLEYAGDFVVMAATLLAIKSRSLLPRDEVDLEDDLDPGDELIERLLEYRRFRDAADGLAERFAERRLIQPRGWRGEVKEHEDEPTLDLTELTSYDLLATYSRLLRETQRDRTHHVSTDPRPLRWYIERVVDHMRTGESATLRGLLEDLEEGPTRDTLVGSFCALLELCRVGAVRVEQSGRGADIGVEFVPDGLQDVEELLSGLELEEAHAHGAAHGAAHGEASGAAQVGAQEGAQEGAHGGPESSGTASNGSQA